MKNGEACSDFVLTKLDFLAIEKKAVNNKAQNVAWDGTAIHSFILISDNVMWKPLLLVNIITLNLDIDRQVYSIYHTEKSNHYEISFLMD